MRKRRQVTWTIQNEVCDALKSIAAGRDKSVSSVASEKLRADAEVGTRIGIEQACKQEVTA